jgi:hypothetical protein
MKQTAVEFLYEALSEEPKDIFMWQIILQQAKEMEKEQIMESFLDGYKSHPYLAEQYYNEKYK